MGRGILRKRGSTGGVVVDGISSFKGSNMLVDPGMNGLTPICPVDEMPDSKMAARVGPAQTLGPSSAEQDVDGFGRKVGMSPMWSSNYSLFSGWNITGPFPMSMQILLCSFV